jgi:hypothetical protein
MDADKDMLFGIPQNPGQWRRLAAAGCRTPESLKEWMDQVADQLRHLDLRTDVRRAPPPPLR